MSFAVLCPRLRCRAILRVPDNVRGKHVRCSECGMTFLVPETYKAPVTVQKTSDAKDEGAAKK